MQTARILRWSFKWVQSQSRCVGVMLACTNDQGWIWGRKLESVQSSSLSEPFPASCWHDDFITLIVWAWRHFEYIWKRCSATAELRLFLLLWPTLPQSAPPRQRYPLQAFTTFQRPATTQLKLANPEHASSPFLPAHCPPCNHRPTQPDPRSTSARTTQRLGSWRTCQAWYQMARPFTLWRVPGHCHPFSATPFLYLLLCPT